MDTSNPFRPFCSARCKGNDFGQWASETFRLGSGPSLEGGLMEGSDKDRGETGP